MSTSLNVTAYAGKDSKEFQKHYKAVKFCIENNLSYPIETSEFFKGKVGGEDLEDIKEDAILKYIENGIEVKFPKQVSPIEGKITIKTSDIPKEVDEIIITLE